MGGQLGGASAPRVERSRRLWGRLTSASPHIVDVAERRRSELLSGLLLTLLPTASAFTLAQLLISGPGWEALGVLVAAGVFSIAMYALSRTRHSRIAASLVSLGPIVAACAVGLQAPDDPAWFGFANVSVILASALLGAPAALFTSILCVLSVTACALASLEQLGIAKVVPMVALDIVITSLVVVAARHRDRIEAEREAMLRASEARLAESRRMESIGRLAGGIAHDFNNLLTVVLANAELLARGRAVGVAAREIETAGTRAAELTRQLLAYARQQVTTPSVVDENMLINNLEPILRRLLREDIELEVACGKGLWRIKIDPVQLEQVVLNLTVNARDAMPEGGKLAIGTSNVTRRIDGNDVEYVLLSVRDTGVGIAPETLDHVFEPFFTTKSPGIGTGLGLATVLAIVQGAGGFIEVDSAPQKGSEFRVYIPRCSDVPRAAPRVLHTPTPEPRRVTVLLVEDDALVRRSVMRMLQEAGFQVREAQSAAEARVEFERAGKTIELVLSDVVLTDGSGIELVRELRGKDPGLRVLLMSGYANELMQQEAALGPDLHLIPKPFSAKELLVVIREVLGEAVEQVA